MKIVQVVPVADDKPTLKTLLEETERRLRGGSTTFSRKDRGIWEHVKYPGRIKWDLVAGGIIVARVQSREPKQEGQLLQAFIGYLDRHVGDYIDSISIIYR